MWIFSCLLSIPGEKNLVFILVTCRNKNLRFLEGWIIGLAGKCRDECEKCMGFWVARHSNFWGDRYCVFFLGIGGLEIFVMLSLSL